MQLHIWGGGTHGFAVLSEYDPGYYGQGIYLALEAEYSIEQYGLHTRRGAQTRASLTLCHCSCAGRS